MRQFSIILYHNTKSLEKLLHRNFELKETLDFHQSIWIHLIIKMFKIKLYVEKNVRKIYNFPKEILCHNKIHNKFFLLSFKQSCRQRKTEFIQLINPINKFMYFKWPMNFLFVFSTPPALFAWPVAPILQWLFTILLFILVYWLISLNFM